MAKTIFNTADGILTPCNVAWSWHWFRQVTALCNVACGSGIVTVNSPSGSTLQCDTGLWDDMRLNSLGGSTLQSDTWLWNHDIEFARWQHPAMWQVALGWHATEFVQTSAILEFYIWFRFRPHHRSRNVILHQSPKFYPNRTTLGRTKMMSCQFSRRWISAILDFRDPIMGSLKRPCTTFYRLSIDTIALNCLVFEEIAFFAFWWQTDRQTDKQMDSIDALSHSRCRERRLKNTR